MRAQDEPRADKGDGGPAHRTAATTMSVVIGAIVRSNYAKNMAVPLRYQRSFDSNIRMIAFRAGMRMLKSNH